jgi:hypothetical protein
VIDVPVNDLTTVAPSRARDVGSNPVLLAGRAGPVNIGELELLSGRDELLSGRDELLSGRNVVAFEEPLA